jgi:hypothetical protein
MLKKRLGPRKRRVPFPPRGEGARRADEGGIRTPRGEGPHDVEVRESPHWPAGLDVLIVSAKYGDIRPNRRIETY